MVTHDDMIRWCIQCCDGASTDEQRTELVSRIGSCLGMVRNAIEEHEMTPSERDIIIEQTISQT